jgi:uncharacterized protein HemX
MKRSRAKRVSFLVLVLVAFAAGLGVAWYMRQRNSERNSEFGGAAQPDERTKDELYEEARRRGIEGRSKMSKEELAEAVGD